MSAENVSIQKQPQPNSVPVQPKSDAAQSPSQPLKACEAPVDFMASGAETLFDILFHIFILSFILQIVFETKLHKLEEDTIHAEVKTALETTLGSALEGNGLAMPPQLFEAIGAWFSNDEQHETINKLVVSRNRLLIGMLAVACVAFFFTMTGTCKARNGGRALRNVLMNNGFLLLVVGAIEGLFVFKVILNYVPTKPSMMQRTVIERLKNVGTTAKTDLSCKDLTKPCGADLPVLVRTGGFVVAFAVLAALTRFYKPSTHSFSPSNVLWQGVMVSAVISGLFMTLGVTQETLVMESVIHRIVDSYTLSMFKSVDAVSSSAAQQMATYLGSLDVDSASMEAADKSVEESNAKLQKTAGVIVGSTFVVALVCTIVERLLVSRAGSHNEKPSNIVFAALIAACCSFLAEFNFLVNVAAPSRPISVAEVNRTALGILKNKLVAKEQETSPPNEDE